jgi:hypothetical protein
VEVVDIYLRNGRRFGFPAKIGDTASHVIYSVAMKLNVKHVVPDLELIEDNLGKGEQEQQRNLLFLSK